MNAYKHLLYLYDYIYTMVWGVIWLMWLMVWFGVTKRCKWLISLGGWDEEGMEALYSLWRMAVRRRKYFSAYRETTVWADEKV